MKNQSDVPCAAAIAAGIYAPVKTAVFILAERGAIAVKAARNLRRIRNARISATGFLLIKSTARKARVSLINRKNPKRQGRLLTTFLINYE